MNGAWWSLVVLVGLVVAVVGAVALVDLLPTRRGDVDRAALRRTRQRDERHLPPEPPGRFGV